MKVSFYDYTDDEKFQAVDTINNLRKENCAYQNISLTFDFFEKNENLKEVFGAGKLVHLASETEEAGVNTYANFGLNVAHIMNSTVVLDVSDIPHVIKKETGTKAVKENKLSSEIAWIVTNHQRLQRKNSPAFNQ